MSTAGQSILKGMREALAYEEGARKGYRETHFDAPDVVRVRKKTGLTQKAFAATFLIPLATLRKWEQGQRVPQGPAQALLRIIDNNAQAALDALH
jgi:putative transcriptional regulator